MDIEYKLSNRDKRQKKESAKRETNRKFFCEQCDTPLLHKSERCPKCNFKNKSKMNFK